MTLRIGLGLLALLLLAACDSQAGAPSDDALDRHGLAFGGAGPAGEIDGVDDQTDPPPPDAPETSTEWRDNSLVVEAAAPGTLSLTDNPGAPYNGPRIYCAWFDLVIDGDDIEANHITDPTVGERYVFNCWYTEPWIDPFAGYPIVTIYDPVVDPPGPVITTPETARYAINSIDFEIPSIVTSPAGTHIVGVPSWFAVDSELGYSSASAQAGPVWATVRPEFRDVTWHLGTGDQLVCNRDAQRQWNPDAPDTQSSDCTYTYETGNRADSSMAVSATVNWTVWQQTDRTDGQWVVWGTVSLATTVDINVSELQAVIN